MQNQALNDLMENRVFPVVNNIKGFFGFRLEEEGDQKGQSCGTSLAQAPSNLELQPPQKQHPLKSPMVHSQTQIFSNKTDNKGLTDTNFLSTSRSNLASRPSTNSKESPSSLHSSLSTRLTVAKDSSFPVSEPNSPFKQPTNRPASANSSKLPGKNEPELSLSPFIIDDPVDLGNSEKLGKIQFSVSYDFEASTLTVKIIKAEQLAVKDLSGTSDPYVKITLLPDKKHTMSTKIKRKNLNPRWNETFAFEGFPYHKVATRTLYLLVLDYDRFSRDDPIGEVHLCLNEIDLGSGSAIWRTLLPCKGAVGKLGMLLVTLCYQPSSETITIGINKAKDLKAKDINGLSDPYVKIWLMQEGRKIEKRKTQIHEKNLNPVFNETFDYIVPYDKIRQSSLVVSVMDYDRMGRNESIGQIVLGGKSGVMEVKHWNEMFTKCRQQIVQWHVLKDFG